MPGAGRGHPSACSPQTLASEGWTGVLNPTWGRPPAHAGSHWLPPQPASSVGTVVFRWKESRSQRASCPLPTDSGDAENAPRAFWTTGYQTCRCGGKGGGVAVSTASPGDSLKNRSLGERDRPMTSESSYLSESNQEASLAAKLVCLWVHGGL